MEEAEGERARRWDVVGRGRFECWKVGGTGAVVGGGGGKEEGRGFVFRVSKTGVGVEREGR